MDLMVPQEWVPLHDGPGGDVLIADAKPMCTILIARISR